MMLHLIILNLLFLILAGCQSEPDGGAAANMIKNVSTPEEFFARNSAVADIYSDQTALTSTNSKFSFKLHFSKNSEVGNCTPTVKVKIGNTELIAEYESGSGTKDHTYSVTIPSSIKSAKGMEIIQPIIADEGCIIDAEDTEKKPAVLTFTNKKLKDFVVDQVGPVLLSFKLSPKNSINLGGQINIQADFDDTVTFTSNPTLNFTLNGQNRSAVYVSGKESKVLNFKYITTNADRSLSGILINTVPSGVGDALGNPATGPKTNLSANFSVIAPNTSPTTSAISQSAMNEDTPTIINLTYTDQEGDQAQTCTISNLTHAIITQACACINGTCTVGISGALNYSGPASFKYTVTANNQTSNASLVSFNVNPVDDAPVASPSVTPSSFQEDNNSNITLSYSDVEGNQASSCNITGVTNLLSNPSCNCAGGVCTTSLRGLPDYFGAASFTYTVTANGLTSNPVTANVNVINIDDAPVANGTLNPNSIQENSTVQVMLGYNDPDNDKATSCQVLSVLNLNPGPNCSCNGAGQCKATISGLTDYNGNASFSYTVTANGVTSNSATANVTISNVNYPPVALTNISPSSIDEDVSTIITLQYSDSDGDLASSCSILSSNNLASFTPCSCNGSGVCTTTVKGQANYFGNANITFTVTANGMTSPSATANFTINSVDDAPVASASVSPTVFNEDASTTINLSYTDIENDKATSCQITSVTNLLAAPNCNCAPNGACSTSVSGTSNYFGPASFSYTVSSNGITSNVVTVNLTINSVDDAPTADGTLSNPENLTEDQGSLITLHYNDIDYQPGDNVSCFVTNQVNLMAMSCMCMSGVCTVNVSPNNNFNGAASIDYYVRVGTLNSNTTTTSFNVSSVDDPAMASFSVSPSSFNEDTSTVVTLGYIDPEGDIATSCQITSVNNLLPNPPCGCNGSGVCGATLQGPANYNGPADFTYTVTTNGKTSFSATPNLTINPVDDPPVANNINPPPFEEGNQSIMTLVYSDIENHQASSCSINSVNNVTVTQACSCSGGVCTVGVTGNSSYSGMASFTYTVTANGKTSNSANANFNITPVDHSPVAANSSITGTGPVLANGTATSTVTITLKDAYNLAVPGVVPTFDATNTSSGNAYGVCSSTDSNGVSTCLLKSTKAETKTLNITYPVTKSGGAVNFTAGAVAASKSNITGTGPVVADGVSTSTITVTLKDNYDNGVSGITPTFNATNSNSGNTYSACSTSNASGVSTCTLKSTKAQVKTLTILTPFNKAGGTVEFIAGAASSTKSTITGTTPVSSDGVSASLISIYLADAYNNPISGVTPLFNASGSNNTYGSCLTSSTGGISTCTLTSTTAEFKNLQLISPTSVSGSAVEFNATAPSAIKSTIAISGGSTITANGVSVATVTVTIKDANNNPVPDDTIPSIDATDTNGKNSYAECDPTVNGVSTCTFTSTFAEVKTVRITDPVVKVGPNFTFVAGPVASLYSTISGTGPVVANGTSTSSITITLKDINNNPVSGGSAPTYNATGTSNTKSTCTVPNASGVSTCTLKSTKAEIKTLSIATPITKNGGTVEFVAGTPTTANSTINGSGPIPPDGVSTSTITIILKDANSNFVVGTTPTFSATGSNNIIGACSPTNSSGASTCTLASTSQETKTVSLTSPIAKTGNSVQFIAGAPFAANCSVSATGPVIANNSSTSTVTVTLKDSNNLPVTGMTPVIDATGSNNTFSTCSASNASGISTCTLKSTKAETKMISMISPTMKNGNPVVFEAGPPSTLTSSIEASGPVLADGIEESTISITLMDQFLNPVVGVVPQYSMSGINNTANSCSETDSLGVSICTASSTKPQYKSFNLTSPINLTGNTVRFNPYGINIVVPIEMLNTGLASRTTLSTYTVSTTGLNTDDYVGESSNYFFEIIAENINSTTDYTIYLVNKNGTQINDSGITIPKSTINKTRFKVEWTPTSGDNNYRIKIPGTSSTSQVKVHSARIIVEQTRAITTRVSIPILGNNNVSDSTTTSPSVMTTLSTSYTNITTGMNSLWLRDDSVFDSYDTIGNPWTLEAVLKGRSSTSYMGLALFDNSGNMITGSEILHLSSTLSYMTSSFASNDSNFNNGDILSLKMKINSGTKSATLYKANLTVKLDFLTKLEIYNRLSMYSTISSGFLDIFDGRYLWEASKWTNPTAYFEVQGSGSGTSAALLDNGSIDYYDPGNLTTVTTIPFSASYGVTRSPSALNLTNLNQFMVKHIRTSGSGTMGGAFLVIRAQE